MWSEDMFKGLGTFVVMVCVLLVLIGYEIGKLF